jgi:hypothetical protein
MITSYKISHPKGRTQATSSENSQQNLWNKEAKYNRNLEKLQIEVL